MQATDALLNPKSNSIFPTDENLDVCWERIKSQMPITDHNEMFALLMIWNNTVIKTLGESNVYSKLQR